MRCSAGTFAPDGSRATSAFWRTRNAERFLPDGIAMAKSLGGGFPMGAVWLRQPFADLLGPGSHGTTFGGTPLGCAVALKILEVVEKEKLADKVRAVGDFLRAELEQLQARHPQLITAVRGLGFMLGVEFAERIPALANGGSKSVAVQVVNRLHTAGLITIPSGNQVVRFLPPLNLRRSEARSEERRVGKECRSRWS